VSSESSSKVSRDVTSLSMDMLSERKRINRVGKVWTVRCIRDNKQGHLSDPSSHPMLVFLSPYPVYIKGGTTEGREGGRGRGMILAVDRSKRKKERNLSALRFLLRGLALKGILGHFEGFHDTRDHHSWAWNTESMSKRRRGGKVVVGKKKKKKEMAHQETRRHRPRQ